MLGVVAMFSSLFILLILPLVDTSRIRGNEFRPLGKITFWVFVVNFFILMWIGSQHPVIPYIQIGQITTSLYFVWFLVLVPLTGIIENSLVDIALNNTTKKNSNQSN